MVISHHFHIMIVCNIDGSGYNSDHIEKDLVLLSWCSSMRKHCHDDDDDHDDYDVNDDDAHDDDRSSDQRFPPLSQPPPACGIKRPKCFKWLSTLTLIEETNMIHIWDTNMNEKCMVYGVKGVKGDQVCVLHTV